MPPATVECCPPTQSGCRWSPSILQGPTVSWLTLSPHWPEVPAVALADGRLALGSGFLLSDRLVATNQRWLVEEVAGQRAPIAADRVEIHLDNEPRRVERIFLSRSSPSDIALVRLADPAEVTPFRLGHANLVRVGDPVWTIAPVADLREALVSGLVNKFESFPEWSIRLLKVGLRVPARCSGGPLLNDLGEVVGILTIKDRPGELAEETCFAQTADSLKPLPGRRQLQHPARVSPGAAREGSHGI